jgi:hypothetical protein
MCPFKALQGTGSDNVRLRAHGNGFVGEFCSIIEHSFQGGCLFQGMEEMEMKNKGLREGRFPRATATCQLQGITGSE